MSEPTQQQTPLLVWLRARVSNPYGSGDTPQTIFVNPRHVVLVRDALGGLDAAQCYIELTNNQTLTVAAEANTVRATLEGWS